MDLRTTDLVQAVRTFQNVPLLNADNKYRRLLQVVDARFHSLLNQV